MSNSNSNSKQDYLIVYNEIADYLMLLRHDLALINKVDARSDDALYMQRKRIKRFFRMAQNASPAEIEEMFKKVMEGFESIKEDANWKCDITENMHKDLAKCLEVLDNRIAKLKTELETADPEIAETIEKKVQVVATCTTITANTSKESAKKE